MPSRRRVAPSLHRTDPNYKDKDNSSYLIPHPISHFNNAVQLPPAERLRRGPLGPRVRAQEASPHGWSRPLCRSSGCQELQRRQRLGQAQTQRDPDWWTVELPHGSCLWRQLPPSHRNALAVSRAGLLDFFLPFLLP